LGDAAKEEQIVEQYKEALSQYYLANASSPTRHLAPKTLQELVTKGILKRLPAAPPGKKIVYRPESWEVVIENAR
jgi:predicted HTH transcriptional regulator